MTWLHCWLFPCGCWLHAASCQLDASQWSHWDCQKLQAFFPFGHAGLSWLTVQSIPSSLSPVCDHQTQGIPEKTSGYWVYARTGQTTSIPSVVPTSWAQRTESLKEKISPRMVWEWQSRYSAWFPPEKDAVQSHRKHGTLQHAAV